MLQRGKRVKYCWFRMRVVACWADLLRVYVRLFWRDYASSWVRAGSERHMRVQMHAA